MFGVYMIGSKDPDWTLVGTMPSLDDSESLMAKFRIFAADKFGAAPFCMAISKDRGDDFVPRQELGGAP
jgi:hypothetical protein